MNISFDGIGSMTFIPLEIDEKIPMNEIVFKDADGGIKLASGINDLQPWTLFDLGQSVCLRNPERSQISAYAHPQRVAEHNLYVNEEIDALVVGMYFQRLGKLNNKLQRHHWMLTHWTIAEHKLNELMDNNTIDDFARHNEKLWLRQTFTGYLMPEYNEYTSTVSVTLTDPSNVYQFITRNFASIELLNKYLGIFGVPEQDWPTGYNDGYNRLVRLENIPLSLLYKFDFGKVVNV